MHSLPPAVSFGTFAAGFLFLQWIGTRWTIIMPAIVLADAITLTDDYALVERLISVLFTSAWQI